MQPLRAHTEAELGWKAIIFVPYNRLWQSVLSSLVFIVFLIVTTRAAYNSNNEVYKYIILPTDGLYIFDTICASIHRGVPHGQKLRTSRPRNMGLLLLDYISIINLEVLYFTLVFSKTVDTEQFSYLLACNRCLRIHHVVRYFIMILGLLQNVPIVLSILSLQIVAFLFLLSHCLSCFLYMLQNELEKEACMEQELVCVLWNEMDMFSIMTHKYMWKFSMTDWTAAQVWILTLTMLLGHAVYFGIALPFMILSTLKILRPGLEFSMKLQVLHNYLDNMGTCKHLKEKIINSLKHLWSLRTENITPELMKTLPLSIQKSIYSDMYWESMRHSEYLQDVSKPCKRAMALEMYTECISKGSIVLEPGMKKTRMLYITVGTLQLMAEENDKSPVLTLSPGSLLCENSCVLPDTCKGLVMAATTVVLHVLDIKSMFSVLTKYPKDLQHVRTRIMTRLHLARTTHYTKNTLCREMWESDSSQYSSQDSIKWIKQQYRHLSTRKPRSSNKQSNTTELGHHSCYIQMLAIGDSLDSEVDLVCLRTSCPVILASESHFIKLWSNINLVVVLYCSLLYPMMIAWFPQPPSWFFISTIFVTLTFMADVCIQLITAVRIKDMVVSNLVQILLIRLQSLAFYADVIAALPTQLNQGIGYIQEETEEFKVGLGLSLSLLKVYRIVQWFNALSRNLALEMLVVHMLKYSTLMVMFCYWVAAILQLTDVQCFHHDCSAPGWFDSYLLWYKEPVFALWHGSMTYSVLIVFDVPAGKHFTITTMLEAISKILYSIVVWLIATFWFSEFIAIYLWKTSWKLKFQRMKEDVTHYMVRMRCSAFAKKRTLNMIDIQWQYDKAVSLMQLQNEELLRGAPRSLQREFIRMSVFASVKNSSLFQSESDEFIYDLCDKMELVTVPSGTTIITFGCLVGKLQLLHKGFAQLNSHIPQDIGSGQSAPILLPPGNCLAPVSALSQIPSPISAFAHTDCQLLTIDIESVISILIYHDVLKDVTECLKEVDMVSLTRATYAFVQTDFFRRQASQGMKSGWLSRFVFGTIDMHHRYYMLWEAFFIFCFVTGLYLWSLYHGVLHLRWFDQQEKATMYKALLCLDLVLWIDMVVRAHVTYYNSNAICITHLLHTARHYLTTSFLLDLISSFPIYHLQDKFVDTGPMFKVSYIIYIHLHMKLVGLYRISGFIRLCQRLAEELESKLRYLEMFLYVAILLNMYVNLVIRYNFSAVAYSTQPNFTVVKQYYDGDYSTKLYQTVLLTLRNMFPDRIHLGNHVLVYMVEILFYFCGWILNIVLFAFIITNVVSSNLKFTLYEDRMKSFAAFLAEQKADDECIQKGIEHFEFKWKIWQGRNPVAYLRHLPHLYHEDIIHSHYYPTLRAVPYLYSASDGFLSVVMRNADVIHYKKDSRILFEDAVMKEVYFVHAGECVVERSKLILPRGSMVGDIRHTGIMNNAITALTHVTLLRVTSDSFFNTLNNFYDTEREFTYGVQHHEDHLCSSETVKLYDWRVHETQKDSLMYRNKFAQSEFVEYARLTVSKTNVDTPTARHGMFIHPQSRKSQVLNTLYLTSAYFTLLALLLLTAVRSYTLIGNVILFLSDVVWLTKIVVNSFTAYFDPVTGNLVTKRRKIFRKYARSFSGFLIDVLSVIPFQAIPHFMAYLQGRHYRYYSNSLLYLRLIRLVRAVYVYKQFKYLSKKLNLKYYVRWLIIAAIHVSAFVLFVVGFIFRSPDKEISLEGEFFESWNLAQARSLTAAFALTVDLFTGTGLGTFADKTFVQQAYIIIVGVSSTLLRALLTGQALSILNVFYYKRSEYMHKMNLLINYLTVFDVSPAHITSMDEYGRDMLVLHRAEHMPWFLVYSPYPLKVEIMDSMYHHHFNNCFLLYGLPNAFLSQLAARLRRNVIFPTFKIVEKGDVDNRMYFIQDGEVLLLDKNTTAGIELEYVVEVYYSGESFGELQGVGTDCPHTFTYRAKTTVDLLWLENSAWKDLRLAFPEVARIILNRAAARRRPATILKIPS